MIGLGSKKRMERMIFESYQEVSHPLITVLIRVGNLSVRTMWYVVAGEVVVDADQRKVLFVYVAVPPVDVLRKIMSRHEACLPVRCLQRSIRFTLVSACDCSGDFVRSCNKVDLRRERRNSFEPLYSGNSSVDGSVESTNLSPWGDVVYLDSEFLRTIVHLRQILPSSYDVLLLNYAAWKFYITSEGVVY